MVFDFKHLGGPTAQTYQPSRVLFTLDLVQECCLIAWQFIHTASCNTELILPTWYSICCWNKDLRTEAKMFPFGRKRLEWNNDILWQSTSTMTETKKDWILSFEIRNNGLKDFAATERLIQLKHLWKLRAAMQLEYRREKEIQSSPPHRKFFLCFDKIWFKSMVIWQVVCLLLIAMLQLWLWPVNVHNHFILLWRYYWLVKG